MKTVALIAASAAALALAGLGSAKSLAYGSRAHPYPVHALVKLPSSGGWYLRVNRVVRNATAQVLAANMFNDKPKAGHQFFMINVTYVNHSKKADDLFSVSSLSAVGGTNVAYDGSEDDCGVLPNELDEMRNVFPGGALGGNICFSVRRSDVASLKLYYEPFFSLHDTRVFFALHS